MAIKAEKQNNFTFELKNFEVGFSPLAHLDSLTERGAEGSASVMTNAYILDGLLTQGPALADLTNGTQAGVVSELINHILDKPTADSVTYGIGATKLFKITPTTVTTGGTPSWPQTITNCTDGESVIQLGANVYGFYNKSSGGDILKMPIATEVIDPDWGSAEPTGHAALQKAIHPVAVKEDIMIFGNGQYVGTYIGDTDTLAPTKLDFGSGYVVTDIIFHGNYWYIAVNGGISGTNRSTGQIYLYDGAATETILADETGIGLQKIGFLYVLDGTIFVAYQDLSSTGGYSIGYISGRTIKKLANFTGGLPNFAQKTLYEHTILFVAGGSLWSFGAVSPDLSAQISQIADGGYATLGALSSPFGTPMIASTDGSTNFRLAKFSGYDTTTTWKSVIMPTTFGRMKGYIDEVSVLTRVLGANAAATLTIEANQTATTSASKVISGTGGRRFVFTGLALGGVEDFRVAVSFSNGNATNPCKIRKISGRGHWTES